MRQPQTIAIVASDQGLLRSLVFALEVEGFTALPVDSRAAALDPAHPVCCLVVDSGAVRSLPAARAALTCEDVPVIFLADGLVSPPQGAGVHTLAKPFQGGDLTALVRQLALR